MTGRGTTTIFIHLLLLSGPLLPLPPLSLFYPLPSMCGCNSTGWNILSPLSPLPFLYSVSFSFSPVHRCRVQLNLSRIVVIIRYVVIILFLFIHFSPPLVSSHFFSVFRRVNLTAKLNWNTFIYFFHVEIKERRGRKKKELSSSLNVIVVNEVVIFSGLIRLSPLSSSFLLFPPLSSSPLLTVIDIRLMNEWLIPHLINATPLQSATVRYDWISVAAIDLLTGAWQRSIVFTCRRPVALVDLIPSPTDLIDIPTWLAVSSPLLLLLLLLLCADVRMESSIIRCGCWFHRAIQRFDILNRLPPPPLLPLPPFITNSLRRRCWAGLIDHWSQRFTIDSMMRVARSDPFRLLVPCREKSSAAAAGFGWSGNRIH